MMLRLIYAKYMCKCSQWEQYASLNFQMSIVNFYYFHRCLHVDLLKQFAAYMKAMHTSIYIQQPDHGDFSLTAHISYAMLLQSLTAHI